MSKYLSLTEYDKIFKTINNPVIINDLPYVTEDDRKRFSELILTTYEADVISNNPSCSCGDLTGGLHLGRVCPLCTTVVSIPNEAEIELKTWVRCPDGVSGLIEPTLWHILSTIITSRGYNVLTWICNSTSRPPQGTAKTILTKIEYLKAKKWKRGINHLIDNWEEFRDNLLPVLAKGKWEEYASIINTPKEILFPKHLPIPTKLLLILERTQVGDFCDLNTTEIVDAVKTVAFFSQEGVSITPQQLENKTCKVVEYISNYYNSLLKNFFCGDGGFFRNNLGSARNHYTHRAVITGITGIHHYQELLIPWSQGVELLKFHCIGKLQKHGWSQGDALNFVESNVTKYNPLLDELMHEVLRESYRENDNDKYGSKKDELIASGAILRDVQGLGNIEQRNPSIMRGSAQFLPIGGIKRNVNDKTVGISPLVVKNGNGDFDGDEENGTIILFDRLTLRAMLLSPHYGIHDPVRLKKILPVYSLPDVTIGGLAEFFNEGLNDEE